jgi:flagellar protein FlgJ
VRQFDQQNGDHIPADRARKTPWPVLVPKQPASAGKASSPADVKNTASTKDVEATLHFDSPRQFVDTLKPHAQKAAQELGVPWKTLVAQSALETGWGKAILKKHDGGSSFNLFNIKAGSSWSGERLSTNTLEYEQGLPRQERASFRAYESPSQSFEDYVSLIKTDRYQQPLQRYRQTNGQLSPEGYMQGLRDGGYFTDPAYLDKIKNVMASV